MISIFNGSRRSLGKTSNDAYVQVETNFRKHIHLFSNNQFKVFMTIILHMNKEGMAYPSVKTLQRETGMSEDLIYAALSQLCKLTIDGNFVLTRINVKSKTTGKKSNNIYLVFPTIEDLKRIKNKTLKIDWSLYFPNSTEEYRVVWNDTPYPDFPGMDEPEIPYPDLPDMETPCMETPSMANPGINYNQSENNKQEEKQEPSIELIPESPSAASGEIEETALAVIPDNNSGEPLPPYLAIPGKGGKMFDEMSNHEKLMHIYHTEIGGMTKAIAGREATGVKKIVDYLEKNPSVTVEDVRDCLLHTVIEKKADASYTIILSKLPAFMVRKRQGVAQTHQPFKSSQEKSLETMNNRNYNNLNQGAKSVYAQLETTIGGKRR